MERNRRIENGLSIAILIIFLGGWEWAVRGSENAMLLTPPPSAILTALGRGLSTSLIARDGYYLHAGYTLMEAALGFVVGGGSGIVLGGLIAHSRLAERVLMPYVVAFQSLPKVAVAPLFVVWFGFGLQSKVLICSMLTFFPLLVNTMAGIKSVPAERLELMQSLCATRLQTFKKVTFPSALPIIFAGLNMAVIYSILGAIVGEFVGARAGLGVLILQTQSNMDMAGAFSVFIVLSLVGVGATWCLERIQRRLVFWSTSQRITNA